MPVRIQPLERRQPGDSPSPYSAAIADLLMAANATAQDAPLLAEMIDSILKLPRDQATRGELKILAAALKELRYAFKVFAAYRDTPKVSIFGSARTPNNQPSYQVAVEFARAITQAGWMVITGAGGGIMQAGQEGAGRDRSFGVAIRLPFEQGANTVIDRDHKLVNFKYFFTRKLAFVKEAKAVCVLPGGFGTLDEAFEVLTLVQTGKASPMPIVLLDAPGQGFWAALLAFVNSQLLAQGLVSPEDLHLIHVTDSPADAVAHILGFFRRYHSSRYVRHDLIIRMSSPLPETGIAQLNSEFADILAQPGIQATSALPEEDNESDTLRALPRLRLQFNRRNCGRLRQMIDRINAM